MNQDKFARLSSDELAEQFRNLALAQDQALLRDELTKFNKLFLEMEAVEAALKSRPGDQRRRLLDLYSHENVHVRLKAAEATLAVAPEAARNMLETIANSRKYPQAGHAGMALNALDHGIFKPA